MELYASGIYPKICTRIDSLFKAGEGTLGFWRKFDESPTCTMIYKRYALLKPLRGKRRTAPRGVSTRNLCSYKKTTSLIKQLNA